MIKFLRRYTLLLIAATIGGLSVYSHYMHVTPHPAHTDTRRAEVCYQDTGELVKGEFKATSTLIRVNWITGTMTYEGEEIVGLAKYVYDEELNATICEVWIPMPKRVFGDQAMDTVGHEFLHCVVGPFHK